MSDIFISYARADEARAQQVAAALQAQGYQVWRDDELPAHRAYADVIEERLKAAQAVVVLWSAESARSQWVRAEADAARSAGTLVQTTLDGSLPPMPFNQIQCADLSSWNGNGETPGWRKLSASVQALAGSPEKVVKAPRPTRQAVSICVLPFANMSGDAEQEYFSDGISEDITTDLSKVSALVVIARNTAFTFKGRSVDVCDVASKLGVSHVLEGSVRKAGGRVRINAQLIDGASGDHLWADRYDRDLVDIFAIQDEISKAIVDALKVKLLPEEKKAIVQRGTANVDAYNLYLMARQHWIAGIHGDIRRDQSIVRICKQAVALDPNYSQAWALMALAQAELRFWHGTDEDALPAAERALAINPDLAEARCVKARYLEQEGRDDLANDEIELALRLDPESWEVNREVARMLYRSGRVRESQRFFEKAADLMSNDFHSPGMLISCFRASGDQASLQSAAKRCAERAEAAIAKDPTNASAFAKGAHALASLGQNERAKDWVRRAALLDPESCTVLYNLACTLLCEIRDQNAALDILERFFERTSETMFKHSQADPDLDPLRHQPRFENMVADAEVRLGIGKTQTEPATPAAT